MRTNLYPTRALTNKQSSDPASRLCRRCSEKPETVFHILQECRSIHLSRTERHNFVTNQVVRLVTEKNPGFTVREEPRFTTCDGVTLKPDIVIESSDQVCVVDLAVVWDANEGVLKDKAKEKASKYACLKDLLDAHKSFYTDVVPIRKLVPKAYDLRCAVKFVCARQFLPSPGTPMYELNGTPHLANMLPKGKQERGEVDIDVIDD
ncbi:hypothetical protein MTO96_008360 [Rhipicephalus appendiculatus]